MRKSSLLWLLRIKFPASEVGRLRRRPFEDFGVFHDGFGQKGHIVARSKVFQLSLARRQAVNRVEIGIIHPERFRLLVHEVHEIPGQSRLCTRSIA